MSDKYTRARAGQAYFWPAVEGRERIEPILILEVLDDKGDLVEIPLCVYICEGVLDRGHIGMWNAVEL